MVGIAGAVLYSVGIGRGVTDMKRLFILFLLLIPGLSLAGSWQIRNVVTMAKFAPSGISDTFSSDNYSTNWTNIKGTMGIGSGTATNTGSWSNAWAHHKTPIGNADHWVQADIDTGSSNVSGAGIVFRCDGTNGYIVLLDATNDQIHLKYFAGTATFAEAQTSKALPTAISSGRHTVRVSISGTTIQAWVNGEAVASSWTDTRYSTGSYVGIAGIEAATGGDYRIDNFSGGL